MSKIVISYITDPYINLSIENYLLDNIVSGDRTLFLYVNDPCVVIGRFQNPWIECNIHQMYMDKIPLLRRQSGGGTVYLDRHNVNFSFLSDKAIHSQAWNHEIVVEGLQVLGVEAYANKRGDIRLKDNTDRKISGSAFKQKRTNAFHHGTMLINSNLDKLNSYIFSDKQNLESKSIASVRSKVANISEYNPAVNNELFIKTLCDAYRARYSRVEYFFYHQKSDLPSVIMDYSDFLLGYEWKIKETPKFYVDEQISHNLDIELCIKKTVIEKAVLRSNHFNALVLSEIEKSLVQAELSQICVTAALEHLKSYDSQLIEIIINWITEYFCLQKLSNL